MANSIKYVSCASRATQPPLCCSCVPCTDPGKPDFGAAACPTPSGKGTVHLDTGRFALTVPGLPGLGPDGAFSLGFTHLSGSTEGQDLPQFESVQQSRVIVLDDNGSADPDLSDVGIVDGRFNVVRYDFAQKSGTTVTYRDAHGATATLTKDTAADRFTLTSPHQTVSTFYGFATPGTPPGRLLSVRSADGSQWSVSYTQVGSDWTPASQSDGLGRTLAYAYATVAGRAVLTSVGDSAGRTLSLQYDEGGNLVALVGPSVTVGANSNANVFPGGKAHVLQYDTANADPDRRGDIVKVFYPKQVAPYLDPATRLVDVASVYAHATPRTVVTYGQDASDPHTYGRVLSERCGDGSSAGGTYTFGYQFSIYGASLPAGVMLRTTMTDPNGNVSVHDFDLYGNRLRLERQSNRGKSSPNAASYVTTWEYDGDDNLLLSVTYPEGNSVTYTYDDGVIRDPVTLAPLFTLRSRVGFRLSETRTPGPRGGAQQQLVRRGFPDPVFGRELVVIEERGNLIDSSGTYYTPDNLGSTPTDADRSRYATWTRYDYEEDGSDANKAALAAMLGITPEQFGQLLAWQDAILKAAGLPQGYLFGLGDANGDGRTDQRAGKPVKVIRPSVTLIPGSNQALVEGATSQGVVEVFTYNDRGQMTTRTDPEGNVTAYVRNPENDPDGDGLNLVSGASTKQYGYLKETHADVDPATLSTLIGSGATGGDLPSFTLMVPRRNTPGVYQGLVTRLAYDAAGNVTSTTDPRGNVWSSDYNELGQVWRTTSPAPFHYQVETFYDEHGNVVRVDTQDTVAAVLSTDPASPDYMKANVTLEADGVTANFATQAGPGGSIRPGWFTDQIVYDFLDRLASEDRDATGSTPSRLLTQYAYDPNGNRVRQTKPEGNVIEWDYDERDLAIAQRVGGTQMPPWDTLGVDDWATMTVEQWGALPATAVDPAVTVFTYDGNGNPLRTISPVDADGSSANNGAVTIANAFGSGSPLTHTGDIAAEHAYDGYDRRTLTTDAVGGTSASFYDPAGNVVRTEQSGTIGGPSPVDRTGSGNVLLSRTWRYFDELSRAYETRQDVFLPQGVSLGSARSVTHTGGGLLHNSAANTHTNTVTLAAGGSSYVLSRTEFDRASRPAFQTADNGAVASLAYDGVARVVKTTDALGNSVETSYDPNGNGVQVTRTDKCQIATVGDEVFVIRTAFDSLNRLTRTENAGADGDITTTADNEVTLTAYDSRGNATHTRDARDNTSLRIYDGSSRLISTQQHMRLDGTGATALDLSEAGDGVVTTTYASDGNGRQTVLTDDNGNSTTYGYDSLDRQTRMTFADGSTRATSYDAASDVSGYIDENGSAFANTTDALGRKTAVAITPAAGVEGTTAQAYQYDGLSRLTFARDSVGSTNADAAFAYDSVGRVVEETQTYGGNTRYVTNDAFTSTPATSFTFPNGRRIVNAFDALYRRTGATEASDGTTVATWRFAGPGRVVEVALGNGLTQTMLNNARTHSAVQPGVPNSSWGDQSSDRLGYDGTGRMIAKRFVTGGVNATTGAYSNTSSVVGFTTAYDRSGNKLYERHLHAGDRSHLYQPYVGGAAQRAYDSLDRLRQYQRGTLSPTGGEGNLGGGSITSPIALPGTDTSRTYDLDGLGNWKDTSYTPVGGSSATEVREHNAVNQITLLDSTPVLYDHGNNAAGADPAVKMRGNGNVADDGTRLCAWDALNRLITASRKSDPAVVGTYAYDALGRRIRKVVSSGGLSGSVPNGPTDYLYLAWQCVEERDGSNSPYRQYVWGIYIDELVQLKAYASVGSQPLSAGVYYPIQDQLYRTHALADSSGAIVEAYDTDAYGSTLVLASLESTVPLAVPACEQVFTGQRFDAEGGLYQYRTRSYLAQLGRFLSRDPVGYRAGVNLFEYVQSMPAVGLDPMGEDLVGLLVGAGAGFAASCAVSSLLAWINNESACQIKRDCICNGVGAAITAGAIGLVPSFTAGCVGAAAGTAITLLCKAKFPGCGEPKDGCDIVAALMNSVAGCFAGYSAQEEIFSELTNYLFSSLNGLFGLACLPFTSPPCPKRS